MDIQQTCELGGFIVLIGGLVYNLAYSKGRSEIVEQNLNLKIDQHIADDKRMHETLDGKYGWLRDWRESHEREASNLRLEYQKQIGKIEAGIQIQDSRYDEILRLIESMGRAVTEKIDKLEGSIKEIRK